MLLMCLWDLIQTEFLKNYKKIKTYVEIKFWKFGKEKELHKTGRKFEVFDPFLVEIEYHVRIIRKN